MGRGKPEMVIYDSNKNETKKKFFKDNEKAYLEQVNMISKDSTQTNVDVTLKYRYS